MGPSSDTPNLKMSSQLPTDVLNSNTCIDQQAYTTSELGGNLGIWEHILFAKIMEFMFKQQHIFAVSTCIF